MITVLSKELSLVVVENLFLSLRLLGECDKSYGPLSQCSISVYTCAHTLHTQMLLHSVSGANTSPEACE